MRLIIIFFASFVSFACLASKAIDPCNKVVAVGDLNWPPLTVKQDDNLQGVAFDALQSIFAELQIPLSKIEYTSKRQVMHALYYGDIDILASSYLNTELTDKVEFILPGFTNDPLTIATRMDNSLQTNIWDDLIGLRGIITDNFFIADSFADYAERYLYLQQKGNVSEVIEQVIKNKADYFFGSKLQLQHALASLDNNKQLRLVDSLNATAEVHMAMSKKSACFAYLPYVKKRLDEMRLEGEIDELIAKYDKPVEASVEDEFNFLFDLNN